MKMKTKQWETGLDGIQNLKFVERSIAQPADDEILVKIKAVSLNYKDGETIEGLFKHHKSNQAPPHLVPCSDAAGVIIEVGKSIKKWKIGDRILSTCYPTFRTGQIKPEHISRGIGGSKHGMSFASSSLLRIDQQRLLDTVPLVQGVRCGQNTLISLGL